MPLRGPVAVRSPRRRARTGTAGGGVAACPKHFVANDSETDRTRYRARVDAGTLREAYLAPFEHILADAGPWSIMGACSGLDDGTESAPVLEHRRILRGVLKDEWGFDGAVISDWAATRTAAPAANAGLDLVMPGPDGPWGTALIEAVHRGEVDEAVIDDKVVRLMRLAARVGKLTEPWGAGEPAPPVATLATAPIGEGDFAPLREALNRGTVLLRNERHLLPLDPGQLGTVALVGPNAVQPHLQGGGSAHVPAVRTIDYEEGLRAALPEGVALTVHRGGSSRRHAPFIDPVRLTGLHAAQLAADGTQLGEEVRPTGDWGAFPVPDGVTDVVLTGRVTLTERGTHTLELGCSGRFTIALDHQVVHSGEDDRGVELILESSHNHPETVRHGVRVGSTPMELHLRIDLRVIDGEGYGRFVTAHLRHRPPGPTIDDEIDEAVRAARTADAEIVVIGTNEEVESEGGDRPDGGQSPNSTDWCARSPPPTPARSSSSMPAPRSCCPGPPRFPPCSGTGCPVRKRDTPWPTCCSAAPNPPAACRGHCPPVPPTSPSPTPSPWTESSITARDSTSVTAATTTPAPSPPFPSATGWGGPPGPTHGSRRRNRPSPSHPPVPRAGTGHRSW